LIKVGVRNERAVGSAGTGVEKSQDGDMRQGNARLFCLAEHLLSVGVVLVALFWIIGTLVEALVSGDRTLLSMLLPAQPEQTWDRVLLGIVVLFFSCYAQRSHGMNSMNRYAALPYPA
jgi:hypothetical protein